MSELSNQYRDAPRLRSPASVDRNILTEAKLRVDSESHGVIWRRWAPVVSMMCVGVLGVTLLLRNGIPPLQPDAISDATLAGSSVAEEVTITSEKTAPLPAAEVFEQAPAQITSATDTELADIGVTPGLQARSGSQFSDSVTVADEAGSFVTNQSKSRTPEDSRQRVAVADTAAIEHSMPGVEVSPLVEADDTSVVESEQEYVTASIQYPGRDWLLEQSDTRFTLLVEKADRAEFGAIDDLALPFAVAELVGGGTQRWVFIAGSFPSRDVAREAIEKSGLYYLQPLIVTFKDLPPQIKQ